MKELRIYAGHEAVSASSIRLLLGIEVAVLTPKSVDTSFILLLYQQA